MGRQAAAAHITIAGTCGRAVVDHKMKLEGKREAIGTSSL